MLKELRLDEATWKAANLLRRADWRTAIEDLAREGLFAEDAGGAYALLTFGDSAIVIEFLDDEGDVKSRASLAHADLRPVVVAYLDIIQKMGADDAGDNVTRMEALDMAKKVAHDEAARTVQSLAPGLAPDLATYRRFFTLLFALHVDATTLTFARGHRTFGQ
ncbi:MAG: UPF0262 family protein [Polyangiaceae bacterium]